MSDEVDALRAEVDRLRNLVYAPGLWCCAKCGFQLVQSTLNAADGSVTARDAPGEKCPNCTVPLWRVTERQAAQDLGKRLDEIADRLLIAERALTRYRYAVEWTAADAWDDCDECRSRLEWARSMDGELMTADQIAAVGKQYLGKQSEKP